MCFSAKANFIGSAIIAGVGIATMVRVRHLKELLFAATPLLFALHQLIEGFVWLGLDGKVSPSILDGAGAAYMLYAQGLLPIILPLSVLLIEPTRSRIKWIVPFLVLGIGLSFYILWALTRFGEVYLRDHSIVYFNPGTEHGIVAVLYVIATCGSLLFSGYRYLLVLGIVNLLGLLVVLYDRAYAFTSLWCAYAALVSVLVYWHFHRRRCSDGTPGGCRSIRLFGVPEKGKVE